MQESIVETLKNMKSEQNLTLQQISSASGVPLSTVNRILSGQTENPSFRDVAAIVAAMDGMLLLGKAHIGEVQVSLWDAETKAVCERAGVQLL